MGGAAELRIKICDFAEQEKGYGTGLLAVLIDALFRYHGYEKMILYTNLKNEAQNVFMDGSENDKEGIRNSEV